MAEIDAFDFFWQDATQSQRQSGHADGTREELVDRLQRRLASHVATAMKDLQVPDHESADEIAFQRVRSSWGTGDLVVLIGHALAVKPNPEHRRNKRAQNAKGRASSYVG